MATRKGADNAGPKNAGLENDLKTA